MCDSVEIEEYIYGHYLLVGASKLFIICSLILGTLFSVLDYKHTLDINYKINKVERKEVSVPLKSISSIDNDLIADVEIEGKNFKIYLNGYIGSDRITGENVKDSIQIGDIVKINYTKYEKIKTVFPSLKEKHYVDIIPEYHYVVRNSGKYLLSEIGWMIIHAMKVISIIVFFGCSVALIWYYSVLGSLKYKHRKMCESSKES